MDLKISFAGKIPLSSINSRLTWKIRLCRSMGRRYEPRRNTGQSKSLLDEVGRVKKLRLTRLKPGTVNIQHSTLNIQLRMGIGSA
jgi:hypothetical protein